MENPFSNISERLTNIESLLLDLKHKSDSEQTERTYNADEVAEILKVSKQSVYAYIRKGWIPAKQVGRSYIIKQSELDEAMKEVKTLKYRRTA